MTDHLMTVTNEITYYIDEIKIVAHSIADSLGTDWYLAITDRSGVRLSEEDVYEILGRTEDELVRMAIDLAEDEDVPLEEK